MVGARPSEGRPRAARRLRPSDCACGLQAGRRIASVVSRKAMAIGLAFSALAAWGQPAQVPRKVLLRFEAAAAPQLTREDAVYLYATLLTRLRRQPLVVLEAASGTLPQGEDALREHALERGAEGWVRVAVSRTADGVRLAVGWADLAGSPAAVSERAFIRPALADLEGAFWDEVAEAVAAAFPPALQRLDPASAVRGEVTVTALAGTVVRGLGEAPLEIGPEGTGRVVLTRPGLYRIEATREGSLPVREERYLAATDTVWEIAQKPAPRWMFEAYTLNVSYPGGSAAELFGPFYFRLGLTTYIIAPWLRDEDRQETEAALPLTDLVAGLGYLPLGYDAVVRPYLDAGVVVRLAHAGGAVAVEPVAPLGWRAAAGVEVQAGARLRLFTDYGPVFYDVHGSAPAVVEAMLTVDGGRASGYLYKPWWDGPLGGVLIDLVGFRLGVRWYK